MHLTTEQIAAAAACGIRFLPASAAQVHRLAMQRKVFHIAGQPVLATRGGGFYETVGTLARLIETDRRQQHDSVAQHDALEAPMAEAPAPAPPASALPGPAPVPQPAAAAPVARPVVGARPRRGERWRMAGAERRSRADRHWSLRQA